MISAKAIWTDNERYVAEATSRHAIVMDTAKEKTANTPMELVLVALCVGGMVLARALDDRTLANDFLGTTHKFALKTTGWRDGRGR